MHFYANVQFCVVHVAS